MTRAIIDFVIGAVLLALGLWWWQAIGPSFAFLAPIIVMGLGGAFIVIGIANALDVHAPTSRNV